MSASQIQLRMLVGGIRHPFNWNKSNLLCSLIGMCASVLFYKYSAIKLLKFINLEIIVCTMQN